MHKLHILVSFILLFFSTSFNTANAATQPPPSLPSSSKHSDEIIVNGERSGPRLWWIEKELPSGKAEIFVLMGATFIPEDMNWNDSQVVEILKETDTLLLPPDADLGAANTTRLMGTFLRTMIFSRGRIRMKKGVTLADKVGPDLAKKFDLARIDITKRKEAYEERKRQEEDARQQKEEGNLLEPERQKTKQEASIEKQIAELKPERFHPYMQSQQLISDGINAEGLRYFSIIERRVKKLAKKAKVKSRPIIKYDVAFSDVKLVLKSMRNFSRETNIACIENAIDYIDNRLDLNLDRANAWAQGNIDFLKSTITDNGPSKCGKAISDELGGLKTFNGSSLEEIDIASDWIREIEDVMSTPSTHLALIPVGTWLAQDGVLTRLKKKGYTIYGPGEQDTASETTPNLKLENNEG